MAASWTPLLTSATSVGLLLLLLCAGAARAAAVQGQLQQVRASAEEAGPLALLVLRAGDSSPAVLGLEPDDMAAVVDVTQPRVSSAARMSSAVKAAASDGGVGDLGDAVFLRAAKRQVRYHQCYFNPISCFG